MSIVFCEKPDSLNWDVIQNIQRKAHELNQRKGLTMQCSKMSGEQLGQELKNGVCFVAIHENECIGTASIKTIYHKKWWNYWGNKVAYLCYDAVVPDYQSKKVYSRLQELRMNYAKMHKLNVIEVDTAEKNRKMKSILLKQGFVPVLCKTFPNTKYYSIVFASWLNKEERINKYICYTFFYISYIVVHLLYKPGRVLRCSIFS